MRVIAINLTNRGWEVLINGVPSPRFDRYRRALKGAASVIGTVVNTFVIWPAGVLALVAAIHLLTGFVAVRITAADSYRQFRVQVNIGPTRHTLLADCGAGRHGTANNEVACDRSEIAAAGEARDVRNLFLICYVFGVWLAVERWLKRRWPNRLHAG